MLPDLPATPTLAPALIELHEIAKTYNMGDVSVSALRGVSLTIARGEFIAIMGASGSGKSTLMNIIGCLDRPTAGSYRLDGVEMARQSREALADLRNRGLGFVFQSFNLLPRTTALENVELPLVYGGTPARERRRRARQALERVGLGERIHHHPNQLSGGQQQRVAIARALVGQPKLILADEPTGNLDSASSAEMMTLLRGLGDEGITLVLVTHEPEIAAYAQRVVVFKDGQICSDSAARPQASLPMDQAEGKSA